MALITHFHLTGVISIPTNSAAAVNGCACDPVCKTRLADAVVSGCLANATRAHENCSSQAGYVSTEVNNADLTPKPLCTAGGVVFTMGFQGNGQPLL